MYVRFQSTCLLSFDHRLSGERQARCEAEWTEDGVEGSCPVAWCKWRQVRRTQSISELKFRSAMAGV
jgi:hypothetical protein